MGRRPFGPPLGRRYHVGGLFITAEIHNDAGDHGPVSRKTSVKNHNRHAGIKCSIRSESYIELQSLDFKKNVKNNDCGNINNATGIFFNFGVTRSILCGNSRTSTETVKIEFFMRFDLRKH